MPNNFNTREMCGFEEVLDSFFYVYNNNNHLGYHTYEEFRKMMINNTNIPPHDIFLDYLESTKLNGDRIVTIPSIPIIAQEFIVRQLNQYNIDFERVNFNCTVVREPGKAILRESFSFLFNDYDDDLDSSYQDGMSPYIMGATPPFNDYVRLHCDDFHLLRSSKARNLNCDWFHHMEYILFHVGGGSYNFVFTFVYTVGKKMNEKEFLLETQSMDTALMMSTAANYEGVPTFFDEMGELPFQLDPVVRTYKFDQDFVTTDYFSCDYQGGPVNLIQRLPDNSTFEWGDDISSLLSDTSIEFQVFFGEPAVVTKFSDMIDQISDIVPGISKSTQNFDIVMAELGEVLRRYDKFDKDEEVRNLLNSIKQQSGALSVFEKAKKGGVLTMLMVAAVNHYYTNDKLSLTFVAVSTMASVYVLKDDILSMTTYIANMMDFKLQGGESFMTGLCLCLFGMDLKKSKSELPKTLIKNLTVFDRVEKTLSNIFQFIVDTMVLFVETVNPDINIPAYIKYFNVKQKDVKEFLVQVDVIMEKVRIQKFPAINRNYILLCDTLSRGADLQMKVPRGDTAVHTAIQNAVLSLTKMRDHMRSANFQFSKYRQEPVCKVLRGGPGTFKTNAMDHLTNAVCALTLDAEDLALFKESRSTYVYNRLAETEFWDGFEPMTHVAIFDDYMQVKDCVGNVTSDSSDIIHTINAAPMLTHQASVEKKGNLYFNAKFVFCTTNAIRLQIESLISPEAVSRRLGMCYTVVPKQMYCTEESMTNDLMRRKVDITKLPVGVSDISSIHPDCLEFHEFSYETETYTGIVINFADLVKITVQEYYLKKKRFEQQIEELNDTFDDNVKERGRTNFQARLSIAPRVMKKINPEQKLGKSLEHMYDDDVSKNVSALKVYVSDCLDEDNNIPNSQLSRLLSNFGRITGWNFLEDYIKLYSIINAFGTEFMDDMVSHNGDKYYQAVKHLTIEYAPPIRHEEYAPYFDTLKTKVEGVFDAFKSVSLSVSQSYVRSFLDWYSDNKILVLGGLALFTAAIVPAFNKSKDMNYQNYSLRNQNNAKLVKSVKEVRSSLAHQMGGSDRSGVERVDKFIKKNVYSITHVGTKEYANDSEMGYITFLKGKLAIMPRHFLSKAVLKYEQGDMFLEDEFECKRIVGEHVHVFRFDLKYFITNTIETPYFENSDLVLMLMPRYVDDHTDITSLLPTEKMVMSKDQVDSRLVVPANGKTQECLGVARRIANHKVKDAGIGCTVLERAWVYRADTDVGDCGSWFTVLDSKQQGAKLYGFHVAGSKENYVGISSCLTIERFNEAEILFPKQVEDVLLNADFKSQGGDFFCSGKFNSLGLIDKPISAPGKSSIRKTKLYEAWGKANLMPAKLMPFYNREGEYIDPYYKALTKVGPRYAYLTPQLLDDIMTSHFDFLNRVSKKSVEKRILTFEESIEGIPGTSFNSIHRGKSAGYPYMQNIPSGGHFKGKTYWFGIEGDFLFDSSQALEFQAECEETLVQMAKGVRMPIYYTDNMKDETRPKEKALLGKTRLFNGSCMKNLSLVRRYFGSWVMWMVDNRIFNFSAVGVNPYSMEWDTIGRLMNAMGSTIGAGDYENFDGSQLSQILWSILDMINKWYDDGPENSLIRTMLWMDVVNSTHVRGNCIYRWSGSLPSGHPLTTLINVVYNAFAFRYCWFRINNNDMTSLWNFDRFVFLMVLGDDNQFSVDEIYCDVFNEKTIPPYMLEFGLVYTPESKGEAIVSLRDLTQVEFLKRKYRWDDNLRRYVAPLQLNVILETPYWRQKHCGDDIVMDNVEFSLRELTLHGKEVFDEWYPKISTAVELLMNVTPQSSSYLFYLEKCLSNDAFF